MDEEGGHKRLVLAASCLGFFVAISRATSVNTALPAIRHDLGGGIAGLQWVLEDGYTLGWRSAFLLNVALVVLVVAFSRSIRETPRAAGHGLDLAGQASGMLALGSLTYALIEGGSRGWGSALVLGAFTVSGVGAASFVAVERRAEQPMLPLGLFANPTFSAGTLAGMALTFSVYGQLFLLSLYFGDVLGYWAPATWRAFLPLAFVTFGASILSGRLVARVGLRAPLVAGLVVASLGSAHFVLAAEGAPYALVQPNLLFAGFGGGLILPPATAAVVSSAPPRRPASPPPPSTSAGR